MFSSYLVQISNSKSGQSILEVIIAMAIFGLISAAMITLSIGGFLTLEQGGEHTEAEALAQEAFEAVRAIRDTDWDSLTCGNCVVSVSGNQWVIASSTSETIDQYTRTIGLSDIYRDNNGEIVDAGNPDATLDQYTKQIDIVVSWTIREGITNSVEKTALFTNWWYPAEAATKVSYFDETNKDLKYATCEFNCDLANNWDIVTVDSTNDVGSHTSLEVDDNNSPHISYHYINDLDLKYAFCESNCDQAGNWTKITIDSSGDVGSYSSLAISASGALARISYFEEGDKDLKYAQCDSNCTNPANWSTVIVDSASDVGLYTSIVIDGSGNPRISYYDQSDKDLKYAECNSNCDQAGNWTTITVDSTGDVGMFTSIAIDINGYPRISYNKEDTQDLMYAVCDSSCTVPGNWTTVAVDAASAAGQYTSLALETTDDGPRVTYMDMSDKDLKYAFCDSGCTSAGNWTNVTVESADDVGLYTSLGLADNKPRLAYYEEGAKDLKYAACDEDCGVSGNWTTLTLDSSGDVGSYNSTNSGQREVGTAGLDIIEPAAVSDLVLSGETSNSIDLDWTAPGDDANSGIASSYDLRYSTSNINDGNWSSATQAAGEPTPSVAGSSESMTVGSLSPSTTYYFAIKTSDEVPNISGISNVPTTSTLADAGDVTAPSAIADLSLTNVTSTAVQLDWTAPGDDAGAGTASTYDVRYSTSIINDGNFLSASQATGTPTPSVAGSSESMTVSNLNRDTTYYFAIKTSDEVPNTSTISNLPSVTTVDWDNPVEESSLDLSGGQNGLKVQVSGNYAYVVRQDGTPDFAVIDISDTDNPSLVGSLTLTGLPYNIALSGDYAYISSSNDTQELQVIDISTPSSPSLAGSFDATGTADGYGVYVSGNTAYLVRDSSGNNELYIINVTTPTSPVELGSVGLSGDCMEVVVLGNYAHIASKNNSQELQVVDVSVPSSPSKVGQYNLSGNSNAITIAGFGSAVILGRNDGGVYLMDISTPSSPSEIGSYAALDDVRDLTLENSNNYLFLATDYDSTEFQVVDISTPASPSLYGSLNISGDINGIAYSENLDRIFIVGDNATEFRIIEPN